MTQALTPEQEAEFAAQLRAKSQEDATLAGNPPPREPTSFGRDSPAAQQAIADQVAAQTAPNVALAPDATAAAAAAAGPPKPPPGVAGRAVTIGGGVTPAHEVPTVGPTGMAIMGAQDAATQEHGQDVERAAFNQTLAYENAADEKRTLAGKEDQYQANIQDIRAQREKDLDKKLAELEQGGKDLANAKIDPDRYWNSRSTGQQIALTIGSMLASAGSGHGLFAGLFNVQQHIAPEIDRDVAAQREAYNANVKSLEAKRSLYGQLVEKYGSQEQAEAALRDSMYRKAELMTDAAAASAKGQDALARAKDVRFQLDAARRNALMGAVKYVQPTASAGRQLVPVRTSSGEVLMVSPEKALDYDEKVMAAGGKERGAKDSLRELAVHLPNGEIRIANDKTQADKAAARAVAYSTIDKAFNDAVGLRKEFVDALRSGDVQRANAARTSLERLGLNTAKTIENAGEQGVLREGETANALKLTTGFTSMQPGADTSLQNGRKLFGDQFNTMTRTLLPHQGAMQVVNGVPQYTVVNGGPQAGKIPGSFK